jgi:hypothetical protein
MKNEDPHRVASAAGAVGQTEQNQLTAPPASHQLPCTMIEWALAYASRGWHVFPLHTVRQGQCSCGHDCGKNAGKHPRVKGGFKAATTDPLPIAAWWAKWPDANIGIATGRASGFFVLDIDGPQGLATLQTLVAENGPLPRTPIVKTARGWHLYFTMPISGVGIPCSTGDDLDVRGDGGYVVAPPSNHLSGHVYKWCENVR